jgi:signal transduction histidine kinase
MVATAKARPASSGREAPQAQAVLAMLDALRVAITVFDSAGRLRYANAHLGYIFPSLPPAGRLTGHSYGALLGMAIAGGEIAPCALAQGHAAFIAACLAQLEPGQHAGRDIALSAGRVVEVKARRTQDGSAILLWTDVTQARDHLARLEEAVALSADAFALYDRDDRLVMANALYARLVGAGVDEIMGRTFAELLNRAARSGRMVPDEDTGAWLKRRLASHAMAAGHVTLRTSSGQAYLVRDRAISGGGRAIALTEITDQVRAEAALAEQEDALERTRAEAKRQSDYLADLTDRLGQATRRADSAKTTLLRTMSHELKTPLNAILGFSDLIAAMAGRLSVEQVREYAVLIRQGGTNLLKIINQIMDLTKISAGRYDLHRAPVDVGALLWLQREAFSEQAAARALHIDANMCPIGLMADADESVLSAMLHGLIDNAVTHAGPGCRVMLSVMRRGGDVTIAVQDDGRGVAAQDLPRILEPFEHGGHGEGAHHTRGAGLGLTLIKAFAELHGGGLELASQPGQGFTARLTLPAAA